MTTLCIIPARSGSKRIPNKNFKAIYAALSPLSLAIRVCKQLPDAQILVSGDWIPKDEVRSDGIGYHRAEPPLHTDTCSMVDVVLDALAYLPYNRVYEQKVLLIQPTQPLRRLERLFDAVDMLEQSPSIASVVCTTPADKLYYMDQETFEPVANGVERAQDARPTYRCDGTVYGFWRSWFLEHRQFRMRGVTQPLLIPAEETCELDTPVDWHVAQMRLEHYFRV